MTQPWDSILDPDASRRQEAESACSDLLAAAKWAEEVLARDGTLGHVIRQPGDTGTLLDALRAAIEKAEAHA